MFGTMQLSAVCKVEFPFHLPPIDHIFNKNLSYAIYLIERNVGIGLSH